MSDKDFNGYLIAILPLILGHVCIPPLSYFDVFPSKLSKNTKKSELESLFQIVYDIVPKSFTEYSFVNSLVISRKENTPFVLDYRIFTNIFVHGDYNHLLNNLISTILIGYSVWYAEGSLALNFMYVAGGAMASLPFIIDKLNVNSMKVDEKKKLHPTIRTIFDLTSQAKSIILPRTLIECGSSGAVFTLVGYELVSMIQDILGMTMQSKTSSFNSLMVIQPMVRIVSTMHTVFSEIESFQVQNDTSVSLWSSVTLINHAAHIQGFICGVSFGLISWFIKSIKKRKSFDI
eukprot:gene4437-6276_t